MKNYLIALVGIFLFYSAAAQDSIRTKKIVYKFNIKEQIAKPVWRVTQQSINEAEKLNADYILIHMNTYGGAVDAADSIRTKIINTKIPVLVFIDNNAASAGALISIACDSIYMRKGASIGAATVVNQSGEQVPDKYQSFMRSLMRATAESHGKDTLIKNNDTSYVWRRNPKIAEAMVDPRLYVQGVSDTGQVLTLTTEEAIYHGFCEGSAENIKEVMQIAGIEDYEVIEYTYTALEKIIQLLVNPAVSGILIMVIIGGIYFELQTPGIGFPLGAALLAAVLYFAPLYLEGLAQNWEMVIFILGVILVLVEIFVTPGFGFIGITGASLMIAGLSLAMVDNLHFELNPEIAIKSLAKSLGIVVISLLSSLAISFYFSKRAMGSGFISKMVLGSQQYKADGFVATDSSMNNLVGKTGIAHTVLRPSGKVIVEGEIYDAKSVIGYIEKDTEVKIVRFESGQIYVLKV